MVTLPAYITVEEFETFLENLYPPHAIYSTDSTSGEIDILATEDLYNDLLYSSYNELYLAYDMANVPQDLAINTTFYHAVHLWRSEGARSARLDLISQGVTRSGVYEETYGENILPFSPLIRSQLEAYKRTVAIRFSQMERDMPDAPYSY